MLLERAGNVSYDDYVMAIKTSKKHGSNVLLKRDIDEIYVNNFKYMILVLIILIKMDYLPSE